MPKGTRVHKCVSKLRDKYGYGGAIAICQKVTRQSYMTGKTLKRKKRRTRSIRRRGRAARKRTRRKGRRQRKR